jgi:hypothetical protein
MTKERGKGVAGAARAELVSPHLRLGVLADGMHERKERQEKRETDC